MELQHRLDWEKARTGVDGCRMMVYLLLLLLLLFSVFSFPDPAAWQFSVGSTGWMDFWWPGSLETTFQIRGTVSDVHLPQTLHKTCIFTLHRLLFQPFL